MPFRVGLMDPSDGHAAVNISQRTEMSIWPTL